MILHHWEKVLSSIPLDNKYLPLTEAVKDFNIGFRKYW